MFFLSEQAGGADCRAEGGEGSCVGGAQVGSHESYVMLDGNVPRLVQLTLQLCSSENWRYKLDIFVHRFAAARIHPHY